MKQDNQALKVALAAAQELPPKLQRQLTVRMMTAIESEANFTVVYLERLSPTKWRRLAKLMDRNNEGQLNRAEKLELKRFSAEVDRMLLANSHALVLALRPELFNEQGRPIKDRFKQALRKTPSGNGNPKNGDIRR